MRTSLAIAVIFLLAVVPVLMLHPLPPRPPDGQAAKFDTEVTLHEDAAWFGGLSGFDVTADGASFVAVTDRGHLFEGTVLRESGHPIAIDILRWQTLRDKDGLQRKFPFTDAEGVALTDKGVVYVSFEHAHRILRYDDWAVAQWPSYTRAWRALGRNSSLEALAVDKAGVLYTIPEGVAEGAGEALVYRKKPDGRWEQPFTLPLTEHFKPVGADFGPDGLLYVLERDFRFGGFRSQVRRMRVTETGVSDIATLLQTPLFRHGNLEGIGVWRDGNGHIRLTMVSDDNFVFFLRSQIVEYVIAP